MTMSLASCFSSPLDVLWHDLVENRRPEWLLHHFDHAYVEDSVQGWLVDLVCNSYDSNAHLPSHPGWLSVVP